MLNGVNINYVIVLMVGGAVLLAAIYHTILYTHRRTNLLSSYSAYLWATFLYCFFRTVFFTDADKYFFHWNPDEVFQMVAFILYIRFAAIALDLDPQKDQYAFLFARITPYFVLGYLLVNSLILNAYGYDVPAYFIAKITVRTYLLLMGFLMLLVVIRKRQSGFYRYLAAGAISMIVCGLISSIFNLLPREGYLLGAISWLMFGFFLDVVFFSSAIGYRIRQEYREREESLRKLLVKEAELQQKELEKIRAVYETREQERTRIAQDLHDEIGATLSGIAIYSQLTKMQIREQKNSEVEQSLERMQTSASDMVQKLSDIVWAVNPEKDSLQELCYRLDDYAREMAAAKKIEVQSEFLAPLPDLRFSMEERRNIYLLLKESINNAVKYSACTQLKLSVCCLRGQLVFLVSDNGAGFDVQRVKKGNGLKSMQHRAEELDAEFGLDSVPGNGTHLKLVLKTPVEQNLRFF